MSLPEGMKRNIIDGHSHIGEIEPWPYYGLDHPVKPIVYDFPRTKDFIKHMDRYGIERALVMSNY
ncbi:MAG: amidohydrolase, partial [Actinomycetota bacterium]|nr:amidohydrolase [Actinomycetota bacterium]